MTTFCVDGAQVSISGSPQTLLTTTDNIPAGAQSIFTIDGKDVLIEDDIKTWASNFTSDYISGSFTGGKLKGADATVSGLATKTTHKGKSALVLDNASITVTLSVTSPGKDPQGVADTVLSGSATVSFTNSGQARGSSA